MFEHKQTTINKQTNKHTKNERKNQANKDVN